MEEGEAAAVGRLQPVAQIVPVADLVHRLIADDLFQDIGRGGPVDLAQHQKAPVEPGQEQMDEIGIQRVQHRILSHVLEGFLAHAHEADGAQGR